MLCAPMVMPAPSSDPVMDPSASSSEPLPPLIDPPLAMDPPVSIPEAARAAATAAAAPGAEQSANSTSMAFDLDKGLRDQVQGLRVRLIKSLGTKE